MDLKLFTQAVFKFLGGLLIVGLLLFLPAGTFVWRQAWLLLGILFVPMFIAGLIMMKRAPDLLRKRLDAKEEEKEQKTVIVLSGLMFLAAFIVAGLNFRFRWIVLPVWVSWAAAVLFLLAYVLYAEVLRRDNERTDAEHDRCGAGETCTGCRGFRKHSQGKGRLGSSSDAGGALYRIHYS